MKQGKKTPTAGKQISFDAVVNKVQTLVDGGLRVSFDLPETAIAAAAWLMECKRNEFPLVVSAVTVQPETVSSDDTFISVLAELDTLTGSAPRRVEG